MWVEFGLGGDISANGVLVDVGGVGGVIMSVSGTTAVVTSLPDI